MTEDLNLVSGKTYTGYSANTDTRCLPCNNKRIVEKGYKIPVFINRIGKDRAADRTFMKRNVAFKKYIDFVSSENPAHNNAQPHADEKYNENEMRNFSEK